jgi:cbb3-type cytochrome oxidase maturation protein
MMIFMIAGSLIAALLGLGLYIYFLKKGQFDDEELIKYQIFREHDPES